METRSANSSRRIALVASFALVLLLAWLFYTALKPPVLSVGATLPAIAFHSAAGTDTLQHLPDQTTLVMLFSMRCPHCLYELDLFEKNKDQLATGRIYLITTDSAFTPGMDNLRWPALSSTKNIIWARLDEQEYQHRFGAAISPSFFIFDQRGLLKEKIRGEIKLEALARKMQNHPR